jgi:ribosome-binding protein aMBF1 (putative translation factor)
MKFSEAISAERERQGMSRSDLFFRSGVPTSRIKDIEMGGGCTLKTAVNLARALGIKNIDVE